MQISRDYQYPSCRILVWLSLVLAMAAQASAIYAQSGAPMVITDLVEEANLIEEVPLSGTVISPRIAQLSAEVSGIVEVMAIDIGDQVETGDEILRLNSELDTLTLAANQATTEQAIQELDDAKRRLADAKRLAERNSVSANEIQSLAAEVRIDTAGVKRSRAEQKRQAARLRRHRLYAPFSGVISRKLVEQGEWIQPGDPVVELIATSDLGIDFQVPQSIFAKLDRVNSIHVKLDAFPGEVFNGTITSIIPVTDPTSRTFMIRVGLNDSQVKMAPGMSASAVLKLSMGTRGVVVQRDALIRYPDGRITVWVIKQQDGEARVVEQQVETGLSFDGKVAIRRGLAARSQVVVQGNEALREGQLVKIKDSRQ